MEQSAIIGEVCETPDVKSVTLKAVGRVFAAWEVDADIPHRLLGVSDRTWSRMKAGEWTSNLTQDQITRASAIIGIYKGLHLYFGESLADKWVSLPNSGPLFRGISPAAFMVEGGIPPLLTTRDYIDAIQTGCGDVNGCDNTDSRKCVTTETLFAFEGVLRSEEPTP